MAANSNRSGALAGSLSATATAMRPPETPTKTGRNDVREYLNTFCREFDITLPLDDTASPSTWANTACNAVLNKVRPLYWRQKDALDLAVIELLAKRPQVKTLPDRLEIINTRLTEAMVAFPRTPRSRRTPSPSKLKIYSNVPAFDAGPETEEPNSPTLGVKHAPRSSAAFHITATDIDVLLLDEALPRPVQSAATSFDSAMTKSFMSGSTDLSRTSTNTVATSFCDETSATQQTDYMQSSLGFPDEQDPMTSAKKKQQPYQLRDMPNHGLGQLVIPGVLLRLPMDMRCEAYRMISCLDNAEEQLVIKLGLFARIADVRMSHLHEVADKLDTDSRFVRSHGTNFKNATLCASLHFNDTQDMKPFFKFRFKIPQMEDTNGFQRKWGGHRILILDLADFKKPPNGYDRETVRVRFGELVSRPQVIVGYTWEYFLLQDKKRKRVKIGESDDLGNFQAYFFAVSGPGLESVSIGEFLEWAIPYAENASKPVCKTGSRLDLIASRSKPTVTLKPEQIAYGVPDKLATRDEESDIHMDPDLPNPDAGRFKEAIVMNDGAAFMTAEFAHEVRNILNIIEVPAVIQARIFGSKGLWVRGKGGWTVQIPGTTKRIHINDSQIKVKHNLGKTTDREHLTFNVVNWSRPVCSSFLYSSFIPILRDRGVPSDVLLGFARNATENEIAKFLLAVQDPKQLHQWVHTEKSLAALRSPSNGIWELADFPVQAEERICKMLEAGFEPTRCEFLAVQVHKLARNVFSAKAKRFKIPLAASTLVTGIADPEDVLEPGQVHLCFSNPIKDDVSGQVWSRVTGPVLVARHPGMGPWDVQKLDAVEHPSLSHLHNVLVFSAKGPRPAADRLSGGDYDGDMFWTTWAPELTKPFKNAPAPWDPPKLSDFGITQDTRTVREIAGEEAHRTGVWTDNSAREFIRCGFTHRMKWNALGEITNKHSAVTHKDGTISSPKARMLVALHDIYIDADKQGHDLTKDAWLDFQKKHGILDRDYPTPPYRDYMHKDTDDEAMQALAERHKNPRNILDRICFTVAQPIIDAALSQAKRLTAEATSSDSDLAKRYQDIMGIADASSYIHRESLVLCEKLKAVDVQWRRGMSKYYNTNRDPSIWQDTVMKCRKLLHEIRPENEKHDTAIEWLRSNDHGPCTWDLLKASALASLYAKNQGKMMFSIAGNELCYLKVQAMGDYRPVYMPLWMPMKPIGLRIEADLPRAGHTAVADNVDDGVSEDSDPETVDAATSSSLLVTPPVGTKRSSNSDHEDSPKRHQSGLRTPKSAPQSSTCKVNSPLGLKRAITPDGRSNGQHIEAQADHDHDMSGRDIYGTPPKGIKLAKGGWQQPMGFSPHV